MVLLCACCPCCHLAEAEVADTKLRFFLGMWLIMSKKHNKSEPINLDSLLSSCDPYRIQTCNLLIRSQILYSVELMGRIATTKVVIFFVIAMPEACFFEKNIVLSAIFLFLPVDLFHRSVVFDECVCGGKGFGNVVAYMVGTYFFVDSHMQQHFFYFWSYARKHYMYSLFL